MTDLMPMFINNCRFILILGLTIGVMANSGHYKTMLIGDRAATMGGAFTAISDDPSGVYFNPAGIVYMPGNTMSGSANTFYQSSVSFKDAIGSLDWDREGMSMMPTFFSLLNRINDQWVWGLSYVVPNASIEHQQSMYQTLTNSNNMYILNVHEEDIRQYVGPSIAWAPTKTLSLGMTVYYYHHDRKLQSNQYISDVSDRIQLWKTNDQIMTINGITPVLGVMWSPFDHWSIGASARKTIDIGSNKKQNAIQFEPSDSSTIGGQIQSSELNYWEPTPTQYTVGVAYFPSPFVIFSMDAEAYLMDDPNYKNVLNLSVGCEWFFNQTQAIRLGVYTNNSAIPEPTNTSTSRRRIDLVGYSLGYSIYQSNNSITFGVNYATGYGKAQVYEDSTIINVERMDMSLLVAASFSM